MTDEHSAQPTAARAGAAQEQSAPHWYTTLVVSLSVALGAVVAVGLFLAVLGVFVTFPRLCQRLWFCPFATAFAIDV